MLVLGVLSRLPWKKNGIWKLLVIFFGGDVYLIKQMRRANGLISSGTMCKIHVSGLHLSASSVL